MMSVSTSFRCAAANLSVVVMRISPPGHDSHLGRDARISSRLCQNVVLQDFDYLDTPRLTLVSLVGAYQYTYTASIAIRNMTMLSFAPNTRSTHLDSHPDYLQRTLSMTMYILGDERESCPFNYT